MSAFAAEFTEVPEGSELTEDDLLANRAGLLSRAQQETLEKETRNFLGAAACAASLTALAVVELSLGRLGGATLILLGVGVTTLFLLLARESRRALQAVFPSVRCVRGSLTLRETAGFSPEILIADEAFLVAPHVSRRLCPNAEYELYYVAETRTLLGFRGMGNSSSANRISTCA